MPIFTIARKDLRIGDTVTVQRAGDVIPQIVAVIMEKRPRGAVPYEFPKICPACVMREALSAFESPLAAFGSLGSFDPFDPLASFGSFASLALGGARSKLSPSGVAEAEGVVALSREVSSSRSLARPKSRIFTKPSRVSMMFSGLRSRCTMPR